MSLFRDWLLEEVQGSPEREVERLLLHLLPETPFANKVFSVGGYVRDEVLGRDAKDLDIVVELKDGAKKITHYLKDLFGDVISTPRQLGAMYPIWQIVFKKDLVFQEELYRTKGAEIEFADTMAEDYPDPGSRQRSVVHGTLEDDVERRDFTVNMLMRDLTSGELVDLTGISEEDIRRGLLRGHPGVDLNKIFRDDPLRILRLVRFQVKYRWNVPRSVLRIARDNAERISIVSSERIVGEIAKIAELGQLHRAIRLMRAIGLLEYIFPEVQAMIGVEQSPDHHQEGDVYQHTLKVLEHAPPTIEGQISAMLHDVGKPATQKKLGDKIQFLGHEDVGGEVAEAMLRRLKFDGKTTAKIRKMVENHMRPHNLHDASEKALRKFIRDVGDELVDAILELAEADALGSLPVEDHIPELRERIRKVRESPLPIKKKPILDGFEIMAILNIQPNDRDRLPEIGRVSQFLLDLEDQYASEGRELSKEQAESEVRSTFGKP